MRRRLRLGLLQGLARLRRPASHLSWPPNRVLVIRPDHLGDLLFATPALRALRATLPQAHIACMVGPWASAVVSRNPDVDEVVTCPFPWFSRQPKGWPWTPYRLLRREAARLKDTGFDLAINLRFDFWWGAALAYLAGIPWRAGYDVAECRPFLSQALTYVPGRHEVLQNMALVTHLWEGTNKLAGQPGPLVFPLCQEELAFAADRLSNADWIALHPGAGAPVKRWRSNAFAALGDGLAQRFGVKVVVTGTADEAALIEDIRQRMKAPAAALVGASLGQLGAVYNRCRLVVGVDSGAMHLAVAVGTPTVHLYGPVAAATFGPWGDPQRHRIVVSDMACVPCNRLDYTVPELAAHPCIRDIPLAPVQVAAEALLLP